MTTVFGLPLDEARRRVGALEQFARIDSFIEADGIARGARRLRVVTGGGLEFELHPDRALDIGQVTIDGIPLAWMESDGIAAPGFVDPHEWLRTFDGGFLTTCGLDTFGPPSIDEGVSLGQHGRVSGIPARLTRCDVVNDVLTIESIVRQSAVFGENLVLRRRINSAIGSTTIRVHDTVTNEGPVDSPHMMMYHANVGWPLVDENAELDVASREVVPRDDVAARGLDRWNRFEPPTPDRRDEVSIHSFDEHGPVEARMLNRPLGLELTVGFDTRQLPWLCEWKFMRDNTYVVGIEPVNSPATGGRAQARADGQLPILRAGESVAYDLSFTARHTP